MLAACTWIGVAFAPAALAQQPASTFVVTDPGGYGPGTLREAIERANADRDWSRIVFEISPARHGPGPWMLGGATDYSGTGSFVGVPDVLPPVTTRVDIDGYTQAGALRSTTPGHGRIMLEVSSNGNGHDMRLIFARGSEGSRVEGIAFSGRNAARGKAAAVYALADLLELRGNYFGLRADGVTLDPSDVGVAAVAANQITISGNLFGAIVSEAIATTGTGHRIVGNHIAVTAFGDAVPAPPAIAILGGIVAVEPGSLPASIRSAYSAQVQQRYFGLRQALVADNLIAGAFGRAVVLSSDRTYYNRVAANRLGVDAWGRPGSTLGTAFALTNGTLHNEIVGNSTVAANRGVGLFALPGSNGTPAGVGNRLSENLFERTAAIAISSSADPLAGPRPNDNLDADVGPNQAQNHPELAFANVSGWVEGTLHSEPGKDYDIEFFASAHCSGGLIFNVAHFLGRLNVRADGMGVASFATRLAAPTQGLSPSFHLTATATEIPRDLDGDGRPDGAANTSELSPCIPIHDLTPVALAIEVPAKPVPAMATRIAASVAVGGASGVTPSGTVRFSATTPSGATIALGSAVLTAGRAALPDDPSGVLKHAGRYTLRADYSGDNRFAPGTAASAPLVVFRPSSALFDIESSAILRRDGAATKFDAFDPARRVWLPVAAVAAGSAIHGSARFRGSRNDQLLTSTAGGGFALIDAPSGLALPVASSGFDPSHGIWDVAHYDADLRMDVVSAQAGRRRLTLTMCAFERDSCERSEAIVPPFEPLALLGGDFNGDGHSDLLWWGRSMAVVDLMEGAAVLARFEAPRSQLGLRPVASGDFNGDGVDDVAWQDAVAQQLAIEFMVDGQPSSTAQTRLPGATIEVLGSAHVARPGDADYGRAGLLVRDPMTGEVAVWREIIDHGGLLAYRNDVLLRDPAFEVERTR